MVRNLISYPKWNWISFDRNRSNISESRKSPFRSTALSWLKLYEIICSLALYVKAEKYFCIAKNAASFSSDFTHFEWNLATTCKSYSLAIQKETRSVVSSTLGTSFLRIFLKYLGQTLKGTTLFLKDSMVQTIWSVLS